MTLRLVTVIPLLGALLGGVGCGDRLGPPPPLLAQAPSDPTFPDGPPTPGETPNESDELAITSVEPAEGPAAGGVDVMVSGTGFRAGLEVYFGEAPAPEVFVIGPGTAIARLPPHPSARVDVTIAHPDALAPALLPLGFRYFETMSVTAIEPAEGPIDGGVPVLVRGHGFTADTRFFFAGRPAFTERVLDAETLTGLLPPGHFGRVDVQAVGINGTALLADAFRYGQPPRLERLSPIAGPASGGTEVALEGTGFFDDAVVMFGDVPAEVIAVDRAGNDLLVRAPAAGTRVMTAQLLDVVDVSVASAWGVSTLAGGFAYRGELDPDLLDCSHIVPSAGNMGDTVELACTGLADGGVEVRFGGAPADVVLLDVPGSLLRVRAPAGGGLVEVEVRTAQADWVQAGTYAYLEPVAVAVTSVTPDAGPPGGGTPIRLTGRGFRPGARVQVGLFAASSVVVVDSASITAITPPGVPGLADVSVRSAGTESGVQPPTPWIEARLPGAFDYRSDALGLDLITPPTAARSGGTWLHVYGEGFTALTEVVIGGVACEVVQRLSSAELAVRSPKLAVGVHDAEVTAGGRVAQLARALVVYDPRSGAGGTRGGPIDETLNVTVWGSNGYGPVFGAFVLVGDAPDGPWRGVTDLDGQVTISGPGLYGPVEVTASRDGFTTSSVVTFDATNVTLLLAQNPVPPQPGGGGPAVTPPPNASLSGRVFGLDKYVIAPPASCDAKAIPMTMHCARCDPAAVDGGCDGTAGFVCLEVGDQGPHCLAACTTDAECQPGYACASTLRDARCLPSPGERRAYCNIASPSLFGYEYPLQEGGWVDAAGTWTLDSQRLGEVAVYCFGGYQDETGVFTPTSLGVHRNLFASPGGVISGLAVELSHPLVTSFRLRLQDPPTWPTSLADPAVAISLDLGPDGVIPFSRTLVPVGDHTFIASHQLAALSEELYNANYFLYTTLAPAGVAGNQPRSYNLVQNVTAIVEDRLPVRDAAGWRLEGTHIGRDLLGIWQAPEVSQAPSPGPVQTRAWAVGEAGTILLWNGDGWTAQTSFTDKALRAIAGVNGEDVWAVGEDGTVRHWDGIAWQTQAAPDDDYEAVFATSTSIYAAGAIRLRQLDRQTGTWGLAGAPAVQGVRGFVPLDPDRLLGLGTGQVFWARADGSGWDAAAVAPVTLRAGLVRGNGELVLAGDAGTVLAGPAPDALVAVRVPTDLDLMALTETSDGELVIVGDGGVVLSGASVSDLRLETIPDYRSKAHGVIARAGEVRVIGSTAFILGPFLHFPIITAPLEEADREDLTCAWTWDGGPQNQYTRLALTPEGSIPVWTLIVEGGQQRAILPNLQAAAGLAPLAMGRYRLDVLRVLNRNFAIDNFTTRDFNLYARDSWATNEAYFFLP